MKTEGVKYLSEVLKVNTTLTYLDLRSTHYHWKHDSVRMSNIVLIY